jgi:hypothetical protein
MQRKELVISGDEVSGEGFEVDIVFCGAEITVFASQDMERYSEAERLLAVHKALQLEVSTLGEASIEDGNEDGCLAVAIFGEMINIRCLELLDADPALQIEHIREVLCTELSTQGALSITGFEVSPF